MTDMKKKVAIIALVVFTVLAIATVAGVFILNGKFVKDKIKGRNSNIVRIDFGTSLINIATFNHVANCFKPVNMLSKSVCSIIFCLPCCD